MNNSIIKNSHVVGIDLGTGFSEIALLDDTGKPKVIHNLDGDPKTPSVVYVAPKLAEILVGTPAWSMRLIHPERTVKEAKRDVGTDKVYFSEAGQAITPAWCQIEILKHLRKSVIEHTGDERAASKAVITVPADFNEKQRQSVRHSAQMAGIELVAEINEPTAAGLAYGIHEKQGDRLVVIPDFGQGTFDCSVVSYAGGEATVLASQGDTQLGGKDVDEILMRMALDAFKKEHSLEMSSETHPADWFSILEEVIRAKHRLSSSASAKICARVEGKQVMVEITRDTLASAIKPLIDRAEKVVLEAIKSAKVDLKDIQHVLLVGGSSRLVPFQDMLKRILGADKLTGGNVSPDLAIAEGAAIHAAKIIFSSGAKLVNESLQAIPAPAIKSADVMPHSLGVAVADRVSGALLCSVILEKNRPIPCSAVKMYGAVESSQTEFKVAVLQGENGKGIQDCLVVGERLLQLPARANDKPSLEVTLGYNGSGMAKVSVKDLVSGKVEDITVDFYKNN